MWSGHVRRVIVVRHRVDFRKRFDGLLAEAYRIEADPYEGDCLVFYSRDSTQLRVLAGDGIGLYLGCRRFEGGRIRRGFSFEKDPGCKTITLAELMLLLAVASFTVHARAKSWKWLEIILKISSNLGYEIHQETFSALRGRAPVAWRLDRLS